MLNCFYKIISRALAERLKHVMDKITQVGQKGYSSSKQCQEVLINLIDSIHTCKSSGKQGALLSLDIRKAFDTISHDFLLKAYKFFNFGDYIIRWLQVIGTNRRACIILKNGMFTKFFDLERGTAQGDTISPYIFNIGYQILLFKLNFDLQIEGILEPPAVPPDINLPAHYTPEETVRILSRKAFAFADDANLLTNLNRASLLRVKLILEIFGNLSGLECNVEKTTVMCINSNVPDFVQELGFTAVNSVTILGLEIEGDSGLFNNSFENICVKIQKNISVWKRFNLSLPGRICIAKTMLYSQINYLGCFLEIPPNFTKRMSDLITNFVCGEISIASKRLFLPVTMGGLGLFELDAFLAAQKCSWIQRVGDLNDRWKLILHFNSNGNITNIRSSFIDQSALQTLFGIVSSYEKFLAGFTKHNENFWGSPLFENGAHMVSLRQKIWLTSNFFEPAFFDLHKGKILNLKVRDFYANKDTLVRFENFCLNTQIPLTRDQFNILKSTCSLAKQKYSKKGASKEKCTELSDFINRRKKGCKRYRKLIIGEIETYIPHNMIKFAELTDIIIDLETSKTLNALWANTALGNSTRTFLFKMHNNTAGYNLSVSHFVRGHSPNCTFCDILENPEEHHETPRHLFFECSAVENLTNNFFSWLFNTDTVISNQELFTIFKREDF